MSSAERVTAERVIDETTRNRAVSVIRATYQQEKGWIGDAELQLPRSDVGRADISWFVVSHRQEPVGVLRILYTPPLADYAKYALKPLDPALKIDEFIAKNRIAEIGRFAVISRYRRRITVATALMRCAMEDAVNRDFTHFITDVFEDDPHSPYGFHTRVLGFMPVATHDTGELNIKSRRITMLLDIKAAYQRLKKRESWMFRQLTGHWGDALHQRLAV